jgi:ABC-type amino acid transport substrate-binding protein
MKNNLLILAGFILVLIFGYQWGGTNDNPQQPQKETTYERVMRTGVIRCAYISWKPHSLKDPNHPERPPQGSSIDIIEAIADRLNLKIEYTEEIGWGNIGEGFATNHYDAVCTQMWPDAPKMKNFLLSSPLFYSDVIPYINSGDNRFQSLNDINQPSTRIAVLDGALTQNLAEKSFPNATLVRLSPTSSSAEYYLTLTTKKADIILGDADEIAVQKAIANLPIEKILPHVFAFSGNDQRFASMMNEALSQLKTEGYMKDIATRYNLLARPAQ